jgi:hypothetical protein
LIKDFVVFEPDNERLAQIIVRILREKGYISSYQIGYPKNKIFIRLESEEEADRVSFIIRRFMEKISLTDRKTTTDKLTSLLSDLGSWLSKTPAEIEAEILVEKVEHKPEIIAEKIEKEIPVEKIEEKIPVEKVEEKIEKKEVEKPEILESESYYTPKLEEWRSKIIERLLGRGKIIERLDVLNTQMSENPDDPSNEKRKIERDTLLWILQITPE